MKRTAGLLILFFVLLAGARSAYGAEKIFYLSASSASINDFIEHAGQIDIVAPQSYEINSSLNIVGSVDPRVLAAAKKNNVKIMPLLVNGLFSQKTVHGLLASSSIRNNVINYLISQAKRNGYYGWQLDLEHIPSSDRDLYSSFVEDAHRAFAPRNLVLSIAAVVRSADYENSDFFRNWSGAFDYARLSKSVDFMSVMTYDDPYSAGPTASVPFVEKTLDYLEKQVPADKISMGIPLYYWGWSFNPPKRVRSGGTYARVEYLRSNFRHYEGFNEILGVPWLIYYDARQNPYIVWFENAASFKRKLDIVKSRGLKGFSAWVLGTEDPRIWNLL